MGSPIKPPDEDWWDVPVNRRESIWLGLSVAWSMILFGWMSLWTRIGDQNPIGETYDVSTEEYQEKVESYREEAETLDGSIVPPSDDIYVAGIRFQWRGLPVVVETGKTYKFHISSYDVQHGFSIRPEDVLSQHTNLLALPGYEWVIEMEFDEPGTYHVICNEFCGVGHSSMHGVIEVRDEVNV
ncbi:cytochrome C oxidase subunit II [Haladaptatus sp. F3-133]|jgi:cytochrome c oxidase subunit 2|uniref:Cytochrome C oxidase subunit II n=1 Tax=Halorutilus salinus TaxID=2487751 RepID=A0A9Q4C673_9EURY|nr:cytochrome C oxidase subunit II [Halorutilus salinus]MCX2819689.1 cytochrome C oxidase subunit II [Halorutilus salinus]